VVLLLTDDDPLCEMHEAYLTRERIDVVRDADLMMTEALEKHGLMRDVFQHLTITLPLGDRGNESIVLRPVFSEDVMTARFATLPFELIEAVTGKIKKHPKVTDVFYDITNKPPATFGWE
jgi:GMP synthase (glutamine-hydrolysing)